MTILTKVNDDVTLTANLTFMPKSNPFYLDFATTGGICVLQTFYFKISTVTTKELFLRRIFLNVNLLFFSFDSFMIK